MSNDDRKNLRDHGLGEAIQPEADAIPTARPFDHPEAACPNCGCRIFEIEVLVKSEILFGGEGVSKYLGCPACPWASPAVTVSSPHPPKE